jgi:phage terminase large subunit
VPRKKIVEEKEPKPYLNADGTLNFEKIFRFQPKQTELLRNVTRNGKLYVQPAAEQNMSVGGIRSGKTCGWLMYFVMHYCLAFEGCNLLVLRRTFKELESGAIADFRTFMPEELYDYDQTKHIATLKNGSRVVFGHCQNNKDRDIEQYLGQAYPAILVDECGQFSPDAWMMLYSRNIVNAACKPDAAGNLPIPAIVGCTNPLGPHYEYYRTLFVQKEPWNAPEGAQKDLNGKWWVQEAGEWIKIYDPQEYACQRSTVLDNPELLRRDPGIINRLNSMPKAKRDKMLLGLDGAVEGQYFDCFDPTYHVINLREDPEAIIWQMYPASVGRARLGNAARQRYLSFHKSVGQKCCR